MAEWLYHATYRKNLASIKKTGLGGKRRKNWNFSEDNTVCLALDPYEANSYCECADEVPDKVFDSGIIVFAIKVNDLDLDFLKQDENLIDVESYAYKKIIPVENLYIISEKDGLIGKLKDIKRVPSFYKN